MMGFSLGQWLRAIVAAVVVVIVGYVFLVAYLVGFGA